MPEVTSPDGTTIAFDRTGQGPAVVIVGGVLGDRSQQTPVAELLSAQFTVHNYDRRGHGDSGFTGPYSAEREAEDLATVIDAAGGSACVYATSGCAVIALQAAASGALIAKLALWEPPFVVDASRPPIPADYRQRLEALLEQDRRGDMVGLFMIEAVGMPAPFVEQMRQAPFWGAQEDQAHTLVYDAAMMGDFTIPATAATVHVPTLVLDGATTGWITNTADALAGVLPDARRRTLAGQQHNVEPGAVAPPLAEFFAA
jgi:pimeloyl-ACP methyl ester carboxylesterase